MEYGSSSKIRLLRINSKANTDHTAVQFWQVELFRLRDSKFLL